MNLHDYEETATAIDDTPRAKASQAVAAQQRAQHHDTEPITPLATRRRYAVPFGIVAALLILLMVAAASWQLASLHPATPLAITPGPSTAAFLAASTTPPAPTSAPTVAPRTIGAYAAPDGVLLGQIEADRDIRPVAHYGSGWVQCDVAGSGLVWLRASDAPGVALTGPDLAPVAAQPQTGRGLTIDTGGQGGWTPEPTSVPPAEPATATPVPVWATSAPAAPADFEKPDIKDTCQFVGCLGQHAVDMSRAQACHALYWQYGDADPETIPEPDYSAVRGCIWEGLYR